ncbi:putative 2-hydroxyacid dehydrogenase HI_1556 [Acinetobacter calcoaceticus]
MNKINITCTEKNVLIDSKFTFEFEHNYQEFQNLTQFEFEQIKDQDVFIISDLLVNQRVLDQNPNLKLVCLSSTGFDHIDIDLLRKNKIMVCNVRGHATIAVAEFAFMLMINLIKNSTSQIDAVREGKWNIDNGVFYLANPINELNGKTLTIIGKGDIGSALAKMVSGFGINVIFSERKNSLTCREGYTPFNEAIQKADIISLHCELNSDTKGMIDKEVFSLMKPSALLVNVGRGALINDKDLVNALENNIISGFAADVLNQEPPNSDHILIKLQHPNKILTAHIAWASNDAQVKLFNAIQSNVNNNIKGNFQNLV